MDKWGAVGQAFENLGMELHVECENMSTNCDDDATFEQLYVNYVQLLETVKVQRKIISNRFDEIAEMCCV